ncbi:MAG: rhodanese-like domain-containing protein [Bacteroidetes bacterium]|nr:rhodanese-like domain-containing protein [Bacteroidota bacterium]
MKPKIFFLLILVAVSCASTLQNDEPWTQSQLMNPADLAKMLNDPASKLPIIFSIGPAGGIKNSIEIGPGKEKENIEKLRAELTKLPKDKDIVIYCGCCPFKPCPNIRPAFSLLNEMKFTNHKLLNLSQNLKADWIDKGYPMSN